MKNQHTPGPWLVETRKHVHAIKDSNGQDLTYQDTEPQPDAGSVTSRGRSASETFANAHLIASAPDLLEALRFLLADYIAIQGDKLTGSSVPIEMAQAAIAKAEGAK